MVINLPCFRPLYSYCLFRLLSCWERRRFALVQTLPFDPCSVGPAIPLPGEVAQKIDLSPFR